MLEAVRWCSDNQSISLHHFRGGERRRGGLFLHRWKIAPAAAVDREPGTGCRREPGGDDGVRRHGARW